jgi:hypothetical protein
LPAVIECRKAHLHGAVSPMQGGIQLGQSIPGRGRG